MIEINPEVEDAVNAALQLAQSGETGRAREAMNRLLREHPANHMVFYGMGTLHAIGGDLESAIDWFDKAIAAYPYFVEAHFNRATALQKKFDVGNAIRAYRRVVEVGAADNESVKQAQDFLDGMAEGIRTDEGIDLDTYLECMDGFNQAFALMEKGDWANALAGFRMCAAKNERHAPTHGDMGVCLARLGRKAEALAELDRALQIAPDYEPATMNRVVVERMEEGEPPDAGPFVKVAYGRERFEESRSRPRSVLDRIAGFLRIR